MESLVGIKDIGLVAPIIVIFLTSLIPISVKLIRNNKEQANLASLLQVCLGLGVALSFLAFQSSDTVVSAFLGSLSFGGLGKISGIFLIAVTGLSFFLSKENVNTKGPQLSEYYFLLMCSLIGMLIMIWANDLIIIFIGLEIMSLALYVLIALGHEQRLSKEAAFKYFILGSVASAIFLYGVALLYGAVGSTYLDQISNVSGTALDDNNRVFLIGSLMILIGMLFKVGIVPFHAWAPDVYQGAPTPITLFMSAAVKLSSFVVLLKIVLTGVILDGGRLFDVLQVLAVLSIVVGNLGALKQKNMKRMLAYSGIAHSGYVLIGVIVAGLGGPDNIGGSATLFYLFSYALVNLGLLSLVSSLENSEESFVSITDLKGLSQKSPILAFLVSIMLLSLAGIPPLAGFFGKFYIFAGAIDMGLFWLAFWGVVGSILSIYYYLRPIAYMYMVNSETHQEEVQPALLSYVNMGVALVGLIGMGIYSGSVLDFIKASLESTGL